MKICDLNLQILKKLDFLQAENKQLKTNLNYSKTGAAVKTFAVQPNPSVLRPPVSDTKIDAVSDRLDRVEQERLSNIVKIEGTACDTII